jgi:hypothetical protein
MSKPAKTFFLVVLVALGLTLVGCEEYVLFSELDRLLAGNLAIIPSSVIVTTNSSYVFTASGGNPPYDFRILSGGGTIALTGPTSARFDAPGSEQLVRIELTDVEGTAVTAGVNVLGPQTLTIYPANHTMPAGTSYTFIISGGDPPYTFSVESGGGSFPDTSSPVYQAPGSTTSATIRVTDSLGATRDASVNVVNSGSLGISPTDPKVAEGGTVVFQAYGGIPTPAYFYYIQGTPNGSVNFGSGVYGTGSALPGDTDEIHVGDGIDDEYTTVTVVPAAPTSLVANGAYPGPQSIELTWNDNSAGEAGYQLERKVVLQTWAAATQIAIGANVTSYVDTGLTPNTPYTYRIKALHPAGDSAYSELAFDIPNH